MRLLGHQRRGGRACFARRRPPLFRSILHYFLAFVGFLPGISCFCLDCARDTSSLARSLVLIAVFCCFSFLPKIRVFFLFFVWCFFSLFAVPGIFFCHVRSALGTLARFFFLFFFFRLKVAFSFLFFILFCPFCLILFLFVFLCFRLKVEFSFFLFFAVYFFSFCPCLAACTCAS